MINRRVFIGSTLGGLGLPAGTIHGTLPAEEHNPDHVDGGHDLWTPGYLRSFQWCLDVVEYGPTAFSPGHRYVSFPLIDKLIVTYLVKMNNKTNDAMEFQETWEVFNWQLKGFAFDIIDFMHISMNQTGIIPGQPNDIHKIYKGMKFKLCSISCGTTYPFETLHPDIHFLSPPYNFSEEIEKLGGFRHVSKVVDTLKRVAR